MPAGVPSVGGVHPWSRPPSLGQAGGVMGAGMEGGGGGTERRRGRPGLRREQGAGWRGDPPPPLPALQSAGPCSQGPAQHLGVGRTLSLLELLHSGGPGQPRQAAPCPRQFPPGHWRSHCEPRLLCRGQGLLEEAWQHPLVPSCSGIPYQCPLRSRPATGMEVIIHHLGLEEERC